jgi:transcriptional regulator with XRE-family HTH domain
MTAMQQADLRSGVAARIREARRGAGLSQEALATLVGVTARTVWSWESGRTKPNREHLAAIAFHCRTGGAGASSGERSLPVTLPREERMRAVVGAIARHAAEHGYPPSMQELMDETGFRSLSVVAYSLDWCEEAGLLVRARGIARGITLTEAGRAFAAALSESGGQPVVRCEGPAPRAASAAGAAEVATRPTVHIITLG